MLINQVVWVVAAYLVALVVGALLLPVFFPLSSLRQRLRWFNHLETTRRDRLFRSLSLTLAHWGVHPNLVTGIGFGLVVILAVSQTAGASSVVLWLVALTAAVTDLVDGMLARTSGRVTSLGGALDGLRDVALFITISLVGLARQLLPVPIVWWFVIGAVIIELLKLIEIMVRARGPGGLGQSFRQRLSGQGKLAIDRTKFAVYLIACLVALTGETLGAEVGWLVWLLLIIGSAMATISVLAHGVVLRLEQADLGLGLAKPKPPCYSEVT